MRFKSLLITLLAIIPSGLFAQNTLTIHQKDGQKFSYGFEEKPVVTFTENELIIKSSVTEVQYKLTIVDKFTFDDKETGVDNVKDEAIQPAISLDANTVCISGAKADVVVRLISSDGKLIQSCKTDSNGSVTFSIEDLSEGIYIINSENISVKILRK